LSTNFIVFFRSFFLCRYDYRYSDNTGAAKGYYAGADGVPQAKQVFSTSFAGKITSQPWYTAATSAPAQTQAAWSSFYQAVGSTRIVLSYSFPYYISSTRSNIGVVAVTRNLQSFTDIVQSYATRALAVYIMTANTYLLVATNQNEAVWTGTALKLASVSTNPLIAQSAAWLQTNQISAKNVFQMSLTTGSTTARYDVAISPFVDNGPTPSLFLSVVTVDYAPAAAPAPAPAPAPVLVPVPCSYDTETADATEDAAIAAAVFSGLIFFGGLGYLAFEAKKGTASMAGSSSSSNL
jgi:hypothetical protein